MFAILKHLRCFVTNLQLSGFARFCVKHLLPKLWLFNFWDKYHVWPQTLPWLFQTLLACVTNTHLYSTDILESCFLAINAECEHQLDALQRETAHFFWQFSHVLHTNCHGWGRIQTPTVQFSWELLCLNLRRYWSSICWYQILRYHTRIIPKFLQKHICLHF